MNFIVKLTEPRLHSFLRIRDAIVIDARPNFFEDESKQRACGKADDQPAQCGFDGPEKFRLGNDGRQPPAGKGQRRE